MTVLNTVVWPAGSIFSQSGASLWLLIYTFPQGNVGIPVLVDFILETVSTLSFTLAIRNTPNVDKGHTRHPETMVRDIPQGCLDVISGIQCSPSDHGISETLSFKYRVRLAAVGSCVCINLVQTVASSITSD